MDKNDLEQIIEGLKVSINDAVNTAVYEQTKYKDEEVSALHKEIRDDIKTIGDLVKSHDEVIQGLLQLIKTSGYIKKFILGVLVFVPSVAGFFAGLKYLIDLFKNQ